MKKKLFLILIAVGQAAVLSAQIDTAKTPLPHDTVIKSQNLDTALLHRDKEADDFADSVKYKIKALEKLARSVSDANQTKSQIEAEIKSKARELKDLESTYARKKIQSDMTIKKEMTAAKQAIDSIKQENKRVRKEIDSIKQASDSLKLGMDSLLSKKNEMDSTLSQRKIEIANQLDSMEAIAEIRLKDSTLLIYDKGEKIRSGQINSETVLKIKEEVENEGLFNYSNNKIKYSAIDAALEFKKCHVLEVHLDVKDGMINEIIVKTDVGTFRNKRAPIDLVHFKEDRVNDFLMLEGRNAKYYVTLGSVIDYTVLKSYNDLPYAQFDITLLPVTGKRSFIIKESTSLNSYFDIAVFTDIKGISGDANGLAQISGNAKFLTNTRNFRNRSLLPFNFISFTGGLSKFDNNFKGTALDSGDSVNRMDLFQRATYSIGAKVNILHWIKSPMPNRLIQDIQFNVGYSFVGSKLLTTYIKDSSASKIKDTLYKNITQNQIYVESGLSLNRFRNFSLSLALPFYAMNIKKSAGISNREWQVWACPSINLMYYSKRKSSSKLFLRYNHFINLADSKLAFAQIQLGYSANLTDLLSSK